MKKIIVLAVLLSLVGCAQKPWLRAEKLYTNQKGFTVELPDGWMRSSNPNFLVATRDGFPLQSIYIGKFGVDDNPLKSTKKKLRKDMLPQEVAEVFLDDASSSPSITDVKALENVPMAIGGVPGFRLVYTFKNGSGLKLKTIIYGSLKDETLFVARYGGPQRYYFDKDAPTFEKVFQSLRLTEEKR